MRGKTAKKLPKTQLMSGLTELISDYGWNKGMSVKAFPLISCVMGLS